MLNKVPEARLAVGYWKSALLFAALIGIVYALASAIR